MREETSKRVHERHLAASREADASADQILFGDVALKKAVRIRVAEDFREGRVLDVTTQGDHVRIYGAEFLEGEAVRFASGHHLTQGVARRLRRGEIGRLQEAGALV